MKKVIKVEWCENFIKSVFKKHKCKGIYTNLFCLLSNNLVIQNNTIIAAINNFHNFRNEYNTKE